MVGEVVAFVCTNTFLRFGEALFRHAARRLRGGSEGHLLGHCCVLRRGLCSIELGGLAEAHGLAHDADDDDYWNHLLVPDPLGQ